MPQRPFARLARAEALPGTCVRCTRKEDLFDLGAEEIRGYGVVYLCSVCMGELTGPANMNVVTAAAHASVVEAKDAAIQAQAAELQRLRQQLNAPTEQIKALMKEFSDGVAVGARHLVSGLAELGVDGGSDLPQPPAHESDDGATQDDPGAVEPEGQPGGGDAPEREGGDERSSADDILNRLGISRRRPVVAGAAAPAVDAVDAEGPRGSDVWDLVERAGDVEADEDGDDTPRV